MLNLKGGEKIRNMKPYRIVLADDHTMLRQGLRKILEEKADLEIIGKAGDGQQTAT